MEDLFQKAHVDERKLKNLITRVTAEELSKLSEPCYYPSLKKHQYEILDYCNLTEKDIRNSFKQFYKDVPAAEAQTRTDVANGMLLFVMYYFLKRNDFLGFTYTMIYYMIRQYTNLMNKQIEFCNVDVFKWTLDNIIRTHLFAREKTIPSAIHFLAKEMVKKYQDGIKKDDPFQAALFISEARSRMSQSIKSFAELYYKARKEGLAYKTPYENEEDKGDYFQDQEMSRFQRVATEVSKIICIYKRVDRDAIEDAKKVTRIHSELANLISAELCNIKYLDQVRLIIELFLKDLTSINQICGNMFLPYVKSLMSIKRTTKQIYFKQQVIELTEKIIDNINYRKRYDTLTDQTKFLIASFTGCYIAMITRHQVCGSTKINVGSFRF